MNYSKNRCSDQFRFLDNDKLERNFHIIKFDLIGFYCITYPKKLVVVVGRSSEREITSLKKWYFLQNLMMYNYSNELCTLGILSFSPSIWHFDQENTITWKKLTFFHNYMYLHFVSFFVYLPVSLPATEASASIF